MKRLGYRSTTCCGPNDVRILDILRSCEGNERRGITGILHLDRTHFLQVIEGPEQVVDGLIQRIRSDVRHRSIYVFEDQPVVRRAYSNFSISFKEGVVDGMKPYVVPALHHTPKFTGPGFVN